MKRTLLILCALMPLCLCHGLAQPNILLIVSEDNGPELGCYGEPYVRTPHLDQLARDGVLFENAFVPYSVCSPSRACFLTGLYPHQNGQLGLATHKFGLFEKLPNAFSHLKKAGYRTALIGKLHVNPEDAFKPHIDFRKITGANFGKRNMQEYADAAAEFFQNSSNDDRAQPADSPNQKSRIDNLKSSQPFFLSINYPDAHLPLLRQQFGSPAEPLTGDDVETLRWVGADSPRLREATADYYNCLMRLDDGIGLLLGELENADLAENTLIVYIGDHGAQFSRGKTSCYEAGVRIPFIVRWPGIALPGERRAEFASTLDILPTFLKAAGLDIPSNLPGRPLQPLLAGETPEAWRTHLVTMTTGSAPGIASYQFSIRDARHKLIINPFPDRENLCATAYLEHRNPHFSVGTTPEEIMASNELIQAAYERYADPVPLELYDLKKDPYEFANLANDPGHAKTKVRLFAAFKAWQKVTRDPFSDRANLERFVREQDDALTRQPGYRGDKSFRWEYLDYLKP